MVKAGPTKERTRVISKEGIEREGRVRGIPPKAEPMVATPLEVKDRLNDGDHHQGYQRRGHPPQKTRSHGQDYQRQQRQARGCGIDRRPRLDERP